MAVRDRSQQPTGDAFASRAGRYIGTPYVWGGESPRGFDCSGLVDYVLSSMGVRNVPRTSEQQYAWTRRVDPANLEAGDLVFLNFPGEAAPGHVMIYAGNGRVIQAPAAGQNVQVDRFKPGPVGSTVYGSGKIIGYGQVPGLAYSNAPAQIPSSSSGGGVTGALGGAASAVGGFFGGAGDAFWKGVSGDASSIWGTLTGSISGAVDFFKLAAWLVDPLTWLRAVEALLGFVLILTGLYFLASAGRSSSSSSVAGAVAKVPGVLPAGRVARVAAKTASRRSQARAATRRRPSRLPGSQRLTAAPGDLAGAA